MDSRRKFIGTMATGLATTVLGSSDRVRIGVIGAGARGTELVHQALSCSNVEVAAFADIYNKRLADAAKLVPGSAAYLDHRRLLDDKTIDAVIIATPQHLHCEHFVDSIQAGKHVYLEKTMAFTVDHAKRMRTAHRNAPRQIVQIGHQSCSSGQFADALRFLAPSYVGKITAIHMHMYRNTPRGKPQWSQPVYPDMTAQNIAWRSFLGEAPERGFDANRYMNWRLFCDYSGGNVHENMSHQLAFWYKALKLKIPDAATMTGGLYLWKDGREIPDTTNVTLEQPEEMLITWHSGFGNNQLGVGEQVLGSDGTILKSQTVRYSPQKVNRPDGLELAGSTTSRPTAHVENFIDCVRSGHEPNCPFELGYSVSIACRMALESYRHCRTVRWDKGREAIV